MKARIFNIVLLCNGILSLAVFQSAAQEQEMTKKYHETYTTTDNSHLYLDNKYGNVVINDWENKKIEKPIEMTPAS